MDFNSDKIKKYTGLAIADVLPAKAAKMYLACLEYMHEAFGDNVEYERLSEQILLCDETRDFLYSSPNPTRYQKGTRPILEKTVSDVCNGCATDKEKVLAILAFIRDLRLKFDGLDFFYGGTEEELIKKGERFCERVSRLMVSLCEVAGIPGRIVFHSRGHITSEIWLDGKWSYFDPRYGVFFTDSSGKIMSVDEIVANPNAIDSQPDWVTAYVSDEKTAMPNWRENHKKYFDVRELQLMQHYSLADSHKYHFEWMPNYEYKGNIKREEAHKRYVDAINEYLA